MSIRWGIGQDAARVVAHAVHGVRGMPEPRTVQRVVMNLLRRCPTCRAALLTDGRHADSLRPDCSWGTDTIGGGA